MEKKFSKSWKSSKQPRKQRKYLANAPIHIRKKMISTNLSKELRKKYRKRALQLRKGDTVKIMRGKFRGKQGKVTDIKQKIFGISVEGIQRKKQDGSKVNVKLQPSNLQIIELNTEDSKRGKFLKHSDKEEKKETEKSKIKKIDKETGETKNAP